MPKQASGFTFSIRTKLFLISFFIVVASIATLTRFQMNTIEDQTAKQVKSKLKEELQIVYAFYDAVYPGDWIVDGDKLYKGKVLINENYEVLDHMNKLMEGDKVTVFLGDTRVTTNVMRDGKRAIGTKADSAIADKVLKQNKLYLGKANVVGHIYYSAYQPLKDHQGKTIGMIYAGNPNAQQTINDAKHDMVVHSLIIGAIIALIALLINALFTRRIISRLGRVSQLLHSVASGDLGGGQISGTSRDEIGTLVSSMNRMTVDLRRIVEHVKDASLTLSASSEELTANAEQTAKATQHIAETTETFMEMTDTQLKSANNAASAVTQMSHGIQQIAASSEEVLQVTESTAKATEEGVHAVKDVLEQMRDIRATVADTAQAVRTLESRSQEIASINSLISNIASRTNILALNAAIEAARAGEMGRGFAVVASEIRKLAEQSTASANQISQLIETIHQETETAVESMVQGTEKVADGVVRSEQVYGAFQEIDASVAVVTQKVRQVTQSIEQMAAGSEQIVSAIEGIRSSSQSGSSASQELSAVSEQQLASMEEVASSAQALSQLAEELQTLLNKFKL